MTNKKISNFEFATLNYFITRAFLIGIILNTLVSVMKQDSWIIPIISIIPAILLILLINYIMNYEPSLDISQKIIKLFKKKFGIVIISILILFSYFMCLLNYLNLNNFIQSQFLSKTPLLAISIMFAIATFYMLNKGINAISRTSNILFYISFILLILSFVGLISSFKLDNLKPFFTSSPKDYITGLNSYYAFNALPMLLLTIIPKDKINNPKLKKTLIISYVISAISLFFIMFETISTFGYELSMLYEYPEFLVLKHVSLVGLSSRIESILIMQLLFDIFVLNIFIIYFMANNLKSAFKIKNINILYFIFCVLLVIGTIYFSKYNIYLDDLMKNFIPIIINVVSILTVILICIKIKISKKQS